MAKPYVFSTLNPSKIIYFLKQALHFAARNGFASTCELLVRSGAALEAGAARNQATPLLLAVEGAAMLHACFRFLLNRVCYAAGHADATSVLLQVPSVSHLTTSNT